MRRHQAKPDQRTLAIGREQRVRDLGKWRVIAHPELDLGKTLRLRMLVVPDHGAFDTVDDLMRFIGVAVDHQPARAFRNPHPHNQHDETERGTNEIGEPPAEIGPGHGGIEQDDRADGAERGADPEAAVDDKIGPAAVARRHQFLDGRVDRGVFAADAGAGEESKQHVARNAPGESGRRRRGEIDRKRDEEQLSPPDAVGEPAEADRAEHGAGEIEAVGKADIEIGELQRRAFLQGAGQRSRQRDFEPVENPGDAEREHDAGVKAAPGKGIEPGGNRGLDDSVIGSRHGRGRAIVECRAALQGHWDQPMQNDPGSLRSRGLLARDAARPRLPRRHNVAVAAEFPRWARNCMRCGAYH